MTICDGGEMRWPNKIRRITIHKFTNFSMDTNKFDNLRSLVLWCSVNEEECGKIKKLISRCRILKLLDLEDAPLGTFPSEVFKLCHLKYLCLRGTGIKVIPSSIKYLVNLETLDVSYCNVSELPVEILRLNKLVHLFVYSQENEIIFHYTHGVKVPSGIGNCLLALETLGAVNADEVEGVKIVREIGKLTKLRSLEIVKLKSEDGEDLCSSIAKLTSLRWLRIRSIEEGEKLDIDYSLTPSPSLTALSLEGCLEKIPQWIPYLNSLTTLQLRWSRLREDPLNNLKDLPNLAHLVLRDAYVEGLSFKDEGFRKLKELKLFELKYLKWVVVEKGSLPLLQTLVMDNCKMLTEIPQGIEHLPNLETAYFQYMEKTFLEMVAEEKRNEAGRLARIPKLLIF